MATGSINIEVEWLPSTDDVGVTVYEVWRDGVWHAEVAELFFDDGGPRSCHSCVVVTVMLTSLRSATKQGGISPSTNCRPQNDGVAVWSSYR